MATNKILKISDSFSTHLALGSTNPFNEITQKIYNILAKFNKTPEFMWVSSHIGIIRTEKVDVGTSQRSDHINKYKHPYLPRYIKNNKHSHSRNMAKNVRPISCYKQIKTSKKKYYKMVYTH